MFRILPILVIWGFTPCQSYTFPVFGTKRYHRATNVGLIPAQTSSLLSNTNPIVPYYPNAISSSSSQYYDEQQPMYALPPNYQYTGGHPNTQDDTYYYPSTTRSRHEYHSYGMPTYHGEYKPSPYYYAPGPSYSYYDDREIPNNPLDDLHEEMLQEDERERQQKEMYPIIGEENWYGSNSRKQDAYTKNFLRNLIAYNRQMEAQQQQEQLLQRDQESDYEDYMDINPSEYEYEQINENPYDLLNRYDKQQLLRQDNDDTNNNSDFDDENVRQLKLLAKHHQNKNNNNINKNKNANNKNLSNNKNINQYQDNDYRNNQGGFANWQQQSSYDQPSSSKSKSSSSSSLPFSQYMEPEYDENEDEEEEEDDDWINWDRKRNDNRLEISLPNDESIKGFSNRKPSLILDHIQKSTKKPTQATSTSTTTTTTTTVPTTTTTLKPSDRKFSGQKEFVLPRPATPVKHMFSQPVLDIIDKGLELAGKKQQEQQQKQTLMINAHNHHHQQQTQTTEDTDDSTTTDDNTETKRSKDFSIKSNANIYDTIKELIAMEEQLEKNPLTSKLQKRFVSNEENLVHELDALKRRSL